MINLDLNGLLGLAGAGLAVKAGSVLFERFMKRNRPEIVSGLNGGDEWVELKTGLNFPLEVHQACDFMVKKIVDALDYISNPVIFRRIERYVIGLADSTKRAGLLAELYAYVLGRAKEELSKELIQIINDQTKSEAVDQVKAQAALCLPPEFVKILDVPAAVENAVKVLKIEKPDVTPEKIVKKVEAAPFRSAEMQALVEGLRENLAQSK